MIDSTLSRRIWFFEDTLSEPQGLNIHEDSGNIILSWSPVPTALSYNIYGSLNPIEDFYFLSSISDTTISYSISEPKFFYKVTAVK